MKGILGIAKILRTSLELLIYRSESLWVFFFNFVLYLFQVYIG